MANYHEWLKMLPAKYQTEVLSVPLEKRIGKIKEIQARVAAERLTVIASDLSSEDVNQISMWLEVYVSSHEKEFTKSTPPQFKAALERLPKHERVRRHIWGINWRLDNPDLLPAPTDDELANFVSVLSPAAHKVLDEAASPEQKWQDAQEFIRQVQISKRMPQVSDEELQKFAATLTPDQREELESKNPEDMKRELRRMYGWHKNGYGPGANPWEVGGTGSRPFKGGRTNKGGEGKFGPPPRGGRPEPSKPDEAKPGEGRARTRSQPTSEEKP